MNKFFTLLAAALIAVSAGATDYTNGFFVLNEDWFGHQSSSINFFSYEDSTWHENVYKAENPGSTLGNTAEYAQVFDGKLFICSKQNYGTTGGRFIVADAKTLKKLVSIDEIGGADSRAFCPVTPEKGYIGTSDGIYVFNISTLALGSKIDGTSGEYGDMLYKEGFVYAASKSGITVINAATDQVASTLSQASTTSVFQTKSGQVYAAVNDCTWGTPTSSNTCEFVPINTATRTLGTPIKVDMASQNTSFAWKHCAPAADVNDEAVYYSPAELSNFICKYDFATGTFTQKFITFDGSQVMYGSVVGTDPKSGDIIATTFESYSSTNYYLNIYDHTTGALKKQVKMSGNYWFPAMIVPAQAAETVTGVSTTAVAKTVTATDYYNLQGMRSATPFQGINIVVTRYADGSKTSVKRSF